MSDGAELAPRRVASAQRNDPIQRRRIIGDGHRGPEQPFDRTFCRDCGHVRQHRVQRGLVDVVVLARRGLPRPSRG